jgi:hypothetical protein
MEGAILASGARYVGQEIVCVLTHDLLSRKVILPVPGQYDNKARWIDIENVLLF